MDPKPDDVIITKEQFDYFLELMDFHQSHQLMFQDWKKQRENKVTIIKPCKEECDE